MGSAVGQHRTGVSPILPAGVLVGELETVGLSRALANAALRARRKDRRDACPTLIGFANFGPVAVKFIPPRQKKETGPSPGLSRQLLSFELGFEAEVPRSIRQRCVICST